MATLALGVLGKVIGAGPILGPLLGLVGTAIDQWLFRPKITGPTIEGPKASDTAVTMARYGLNIPSVYGLMRVGGNIIYSNAIVEHRHSSTHTQDMGKSGTYSQTSISYTYTRTFAVAICKGPIKSIKCVWADGMIIRYNNASDMSKWCSSMTVYLGTEDQLVDPTIQALKGANPVPAFRGLAYVVFENMELAKFGNRIPNLTFEVEGDSGSFINRWDVLETFEGSQNKYPNVTLGFDDDYTEDYTGVMSGRVSGVVPTDYVVDLFAVSDREYFQHRYTVNADFTWGDSYDVHDGVKVCQMVLATEPLPTDVSLYGDFHDDSKVYAWQWVGSGVIRSKEIPDQSPAKDYIWDRCWSYDQAALIIGLICDSQLTQAEYYLGGLLKGFVQSGSKTGAISFSVNAFNGKEIDPYYRTGAVAWAANALAFYLEKYPTGDLYDDCFDQLIETLDYLLTLQVTDIADPRYGLLKGGTGKYDTTTWVFDPTYEITWCSTEHNIDAYFAFAKGVTVLGAGYPQFETARDLIKDSLINNVWNSSLNRFNQGIRTTGPDTENALDINSWGYIFLKAVGETAKAAYAYAQMNNFRYTDKGVSGYRPYLKAGEYIQSKPTVWVEGTFGVIMARLLEGVTTPTERTEGIREFNEIMKLWNQGGGFPYATTVDPIFEISDWLSVIGVAWSFIAQYPRGFWETSYLSVASSLTTGAIPVSYVVGDLCDKVGLPAKSILIASGLGTIEGFIISDKTTAKSAIQSLANAYFFDAIESGGVIKFVSKTNNQATTLLTTDFIKERSKPEIVITRKFEKELPKRVEIQYMNVDSDYQTGYQIETKQSATNDISLTISVPIAMDGIEAKKIARDSLYLAWLQRQTVEFALSAKYMYLEPGDVVTFTYKTKTFILAIIKTDLDAAGNIHITAVPSGMLLSGAEVVTETGNGSSIVYTDAEDTTLLFMDIPMLDDTADDSGIYVEASGAAVGKWQGCSLYKATTQTGDYAFVTTIPGPATYGVLATALQPAESTSIWDNGNSCDVTLTVGTLTTATEANVLNGSNMAYIGGELIQFKTATLKSAGTYTISGLLRGRRGTEAYNVEHAIGTQFILVRSGDLVRISRDIVDLNVEQWYKAVTFDGDPAPDAVNFTKQGRALMPLTPCHVRGYRQTSGDMIIKWKRRSRRSWEWADKVDVPLDTNFEYYEIQIMHGSDPKRTLYSITESVTYTVAEQTTDWGGLKNPAEVRVRQVNAGAPLGDFSGRVSV